MRGRAKKETGQRGVMFWVYCFIFVIFGNLALMEGELNVVPLIYAGALSVMIAYANMILKRYFPKGDRYILVLANTL